MAPEAVAEYCKHLVHLCTAAWSWARISKSGPGPSLTAPCWRVKDPVCVHRKQGRERVPRWERTGGGLRANDRGQRACQPRVRVLLTPQRLTRPLASVKRSTAPSSPRSAPVQRSSFLELHLYVVGEGECLVLRP